MLVSWRTRWPRSPMDVNAPYIARRFDCVISPCTSPWARLPRLKHYRFDGGGEKSKIVKTGITRGTWTVRFCLGPITLSLNDGFLFYQIILRLIWDWDKLEISFRSILRWMVVHGGKEYERFQLTNKRMTSADERRTNVSYRWDDRYFIYFIRKTPYGNTAKSQYATTASIIIISVQCSFAHDPNDTCNFVSVWIDSTCANNTRTHIKKCFPFY